MALPAVYADQSLTKLNAIGLLYLSCIASFYIPNAYWMIL